MRSTPHPGLIAAVRPGSPADEAGVTRGDQLLTIAGRAPRDAVDVWFYQAEAEVEAVFRKREGGYEDAILFEKEIDEDLGLEFAEATWDGVELCNNNCFFCFLKGLPRGMRRPLYLKDDDYRLSFLHGNFVTLTNLGAADWERLAEQRLSPLNVSVHATDPALRRQMLGNPQAPDVLAQISRLGTLDIKVHTQLVVTPKLNDGAQLDRSLSELSALHPTVQTISVVPVGASPLLEQRSVTGHGIPLERPDKHSAREIVSLVRRHQATCRRRYGRPIAFCADEYYLTAGRQLPSARSYGSFPQFENGIGMARKLLDGWRRERRRLATDPMDLHGQRVAIATGTLAAPLLQSIASELRDLTGAQIEVWPVVNRLFGERVNVSGLICGADFVASLPAPAGADLVILPRTSLDYYGAHFLDDMTPAELARHLGAPLAFALSAADLIDALGAGTGRPAAYSSQPNGIGWSERPDSLESVAGRR